MYGIVKCLPVSRRKSISDELAEPVEVVDHHRAARRPARSRGTARAGRGSRPRSRSSVSRSSRFRSRRAARRVADHPGPAADQRDRPPAEPLQAQQPEDRHQVADVERVGRRVEADVAGDRPPVARRAGRPGRGRVQDAPPFELVEQSARGLAAASDRTLAVTASSVEASGPSGRRTTVRSRPLCYRAALRCRPASRGASAIGGRSSGRPDGRGGSTIGRILVAILVIFLLVTLLTGRAPGSLFAVGAYNHYAAGPARPEGRADQPRFRAADDRLRPDRQGRARPPRRRSSREVVTFDQIPGEMLDATTAIEDKDFWINAGLRPGRHRRPPASTRCPGRPRGASTITQQLVRARLLPPEAFEGTTYERKVREIIQSIRLTAGLPGRGGQATDHHGLPQPELLRQPELRREGGGQGLLRQDARGPDARPVRDPRRDPAVADEVRPHPERRRGLPRGRRPRATECTEVPARRARRRPRSSSAATTSST